MLDSINLLKQRDFRKICGLGLQPQDCRKRRAVLLIARLDRLARNVAFIANLMESGADFVAVDMPQATRLTIHILAAVADNAERAIMQSHTAEVAMGPACQ